MTKPIPVAPFTLRECEEYAVWKKRHVAFRNLPAIKGKFLAERRGTDERFWSLSYEKPALNAWRGFSFERICFWHIPQIKQALGISSFASLRRTLYHINEIRATIRLIMAYIFSYLHSMTRFEKRYRVPMSSF